uniref:High osmolarity signaling protein SHO1 (Osmosensor SHO1) n=1 Tax=Ganoderma boninense TaxID=34458 RepID=A0A5K1K183_9APHY|nr:High osmolarity signaling protein SHO1 (Osmosensor SHO1) [Ganoderma boninense]
MVKTTTVNVLQHQHDELLPDCEPSFADVVYLLTTPPPITDLNKTWDLGSRVSSYLALFAYSIAHPKQFALWVNDAWTIRISQTIAGATYADARREGANAAMPKAVFAFCVARLFLFAPRGPEVRARALLRSVPVRCPPVDGTVRIKWYPDLEAMKRWPSGMGELWVDVPVDCDGSVDLKIVMDRWGMQNCYVIDANRARPHLWRRHVEKLSALAISILLADGHKVIGVVERPSKPLQIAREYRASLVHLRHQAWLHFTVVCLVLLAFGTVVVHDLEDLGCIAQDFLAPLARTVLGMVQAWLAAVLEAAFLTDDETRRCMMQTVDSKVLNEPEEWSKDCDEMDGWYA